jgi:hypothetical protein
MMHWVPRFQYMGVWKILRIQTMTVAVSCGWFGRLIWLPLVCSSLQGGKQKIRKARSHWQGHYWADCWRGCAFLLVAAKFVVRALLSYIVWTLSICIFSLSCQINICWVSKWIFNLNMCSFFPLHLNDKILIFQFLHLPKNYVSIL